MQWRNVHAAILGQIFLFYIEFFMPVCYFLDGRQEFFYNILMFFPCAKNKAFFTKRLDTPNQMRTILANREPRTANREPRTANREPPNPHYSKCNFSHKEAFAGFAHKRIGCGLFKFLEPNHKTLQNKISRLKSAAHIVHRISTCAFREVEASCNAAL